MNCFLQQNAIQEALPYRKKKKERELPGQRINYAMTDTGPRAKIEFLQGGFSE